METIMYRKTDEHPWLQELHTSEHTNSTASTPPTTHAIWKRVSNRANARPRTSSGPSRCMRLSNASRPTDALDATRKPVVSNAARPYERARKMSTTPGMTSAPTSSHSSRTRLRTWGAKIVPKPLPIALVSSSAP